MTVSFTLSCFYHSTSKHKLDKQGQNLDLIKIRDEMDMNIQGNLLEFLFWPLVYLCIESTKERGSRRRWSARAKCEHVSPYLQTSLCLQLGGACSCFFWHGMKCRKVNGSRQTERETQTEQRDVISNQPWLGRNKHTNEFISLNSVIYIHIALPFDSLSGWFWATVLLRSREVFKDTGKCWYGA